MTKVLDKGRGVYHFLADRTPRNVPVVEPRPRHANPWVRDGKVLLSKVKAEADVKASAARSLDLLGGLGRAISRGDKVFVKPNFNSDAPPPASSDPAFLRAVAELLLEAGAKVTIGESSGGLWRPTRNVLQNLGIFDLARDLGVELISLEDRRDDWVRVKISGDYLHSLCIPRSAYEADRLVYLPCMKTHSLARFSGAIKLAMGFAHPGERRAFHMGNLEQKVAEINLCWQPHLIIMDGRKAFVSGGPDKGQLAEPPPGIMLASGDLAAIDVEAMKVLLAYEAHNMLPLDPWQAPQIVATVKHGLGVNRDGYSVVE